MPEVIQIEGDVVRIINTEILREVPLAAVLPQIEHRPPVTIGLLPKSTRFMMWDESNPQAKMVKILAELEPGRRWARYNDRRYNLSLPWQYFLFTMTGTGDILQNGRLAAHNTQVFWARHPITSLDSPIGRALIPNCDNQGNICWGNTGVDVQLPLGTRIDRTIAEFWQTIFTHDSGTGVPWGSETGSLTWARWHRESVADPNAWMRFPEWERDRGAVGGPAIGPMRTVRQVLADAGMRPTEMVIDGAIPDLQVPFTFGRAEEWLRERITSPVDRFRLLTALQNLQADDPGIVEAPAPVVARNGNAADMDIGGEPL